MEKKPFLTEAMAQEIIQDVPTPFHVYDEKGIREDPQGGGLRCGLLVPD